MEVGQTVFKQPNPSSEKASKTIFVLDEYSMAILPTGWLEKLVTGLNERLKSKNSGARLKTRFGLVTFGEEIRVYTNRRREMLFDAGSLGELLNQAVPMAMYNGSSWDAYAAVQYALGHVQTTAGKRAATMIMLITDTHRVGRHSENAITRPSLISLFRQSQVKLDIIADIRLSLNGQRVLGTNGNDAFLADASTLQKGTPTARPVIGHSYGRTRYDFVNLALTLSGFVWDFNILRRNTSSILKALKQSASRRLVERLQSCEKCMCRRRNGQVDMHCVAAESQEECACRERRGTVRSK